MGSLSLHFKERGSSKVVTGKTVTLPDSYNNRKKSKMGLYCGLFHILNYTGLKTKDRKTGEETLKELKERNAKVQIIFQRSMFRRLNVLNIPTQLNTERFQIANKHMK